MQRLGALLVEQGSLKPEQLDFGLNVQKNNGHARIGQVLKHYHFITELDIARALSHQVGWPLYTGVYVLDEPLAKRLGFDFLKEKCIFPLRLAQDLVFVLVRTDDTSTTDTIVRALCRPPRFMVGLESQVRKALEAHEHREEQASPAIEGDDILTWFEALLEKAVAQSATDIHIEPSQKAVEIRLRMDGLLRFTDSLRLAHLPKLVNIVFNKADVNISDFYHFHDARFSHACSGRVVDVRVSHVPGVHGSTLVLRLLDKNKTAIALTDLGYTQKHWGLIEESLMKPDGVTLIVGPTGCGKTTSLYAMLNSLKDLSRKIVTIEDPVEMQLPLMTQVQVHEGRGITFGSSVRAFLRHDPDMMLVGEVRDKETAIEAMRAAMTGHKVFATLHATRAADALLRLNDLGAQAHYVANCLTMIIAQRLVRKLCPKCRDIKSVRKADMKNFYHKYLCDESMPVAFSVGCEHCDHGYQGRTIVAEVLFFNAQIQEAVARQEWASLKEILRNSDRYISFEEDARRLVAEGITSLEEIVRVLG